MFIHSIYIYSIFVNAVISPVIDTVGVVVVVVDPTPPTCCKQSPDPNHVAANSLSPQVARKGSTLSGFVQRSRLEREVGRDLHSNKWEEV